MIVVGSGLAGLVTAFRASARHDVVLVTKGDIGESNTAYAQGGIAAALFPDDSVESHIRDTLIAGAGLCDPSAVDVLCGDGPDRVRDLIALGVDFDRDGEELARGQEGAHSARRIVHAGGDATGRAVRDALVAAVRGVAVDVREHCFVRDLVVDGGRVAGIRIVDADGAERELAAETVVLATGGAGQLFAHTTNPEVATGDGVAAAWRAGAAVADLEFVQFHPTALAVPGTPLVSEAVRGEGAVLLDELGERFMLAVHPDAELAPRDVVARGIADAMQRQGGRPVVLDATALGADSLAARFPGLVALCAQHGLDPAREPIPVTPAAHYWMGGVSTDDSGRTTLPGLYAVGEVARTGVHGANRLASNSLLEAIVFAWRAAAAIDAEPDVARPQPVEPRNTPTEPRNTPVEPVETRAVETRASPIRAVEPAPDPRLCAANRPASRPITRERLQQLMWESVGLSRDRVGLERASRRLALARVEGHTIRDRETANLLELARLVTCAALRRQESRGAHTRSDHPDSDVTLERSTELTRAPEEATHAHSGIR